MTKDLKSKANLQRKMSLLKHWSKVGRKETTCNGYKMKRRNSIRKYVHRTVCEEKLGRVLRPDESVHHINGDKLDNRPENLQVMSASAHSRLHALEKKLGHTKGIEPANKTSPEVQSKIRNLRRQGLKLQAICLVVGLSYPTVQKYSKQP